MNNVFTHLLGENNLKPISDLMVKPTRSPEKFDLLGFGVPNVQQQVVRRLLETAYAEITSLLNNGGRDVVVADQSHNEDDPNGYMGEDRPQTHQEALDAAVLAGAMVFRFAEHLASVKGGNAQWATQGFELPPEWMSNDPADEEVVTICRAKGKALAAMIANGDPRIHCETRFLQPVISSFGDWLKNQVRREMAKDTDEASPWLFKLTNALRTADEEMKGITHIGIDTVKSAIGNWANEPAFGRSVTRLEGAVIQASDTKWMFQYEAVLLDGGKIKPSPTNELLLPFSPKFNEVRQAFAKSNELYNFLVGKLEAQVDALANQEPVIAAEADKAYEQALVWADASLVVMLQESDALADLEYAKSVQEAKRAQRNADRELLRGSTMLAIKEQAVQLALHQREIDKKRAEQQKRLDELTASLQPKAPRERKPAKKVKAKRKAVVKPALVQVEQTPKAADIFDAA